MTEQKQDRCTFSPGERFKACKPAAKRTICDSNSLQEQQYGQRDLTLMYHLLGSGPLPNIVRLTDKSIWWLESDVDQ